MVIVNCLSIWYAELLLSLLEQANTHIHANPELKDVKVWQVHTLLKGLEKIAASASIPMLAAGDFNSVPGRFVSSLSTTSCLVRVCNCWTKLEVNSPLVDQLWQCATLTADNRESGRSTSRAGD